MSFNTSLYFLKHMFLENTRPKIGAQITDAETLFELAKARKCVFWNGKHRPAAWLINCNFGQIHRNLQSGSIRHYDQKRLKAATIWDWRLPTRMQQEGAIK